MGRTPCIKTYTSFAHSEYKAEKMQKGIKSAFAYAGASSAFAVLSFFLLTMFET